MRHPGANQVANLLWSKLTIKLSCKVWRIKLIQQQQMNKFIHKVQLKLFHNNLKQMQQQVIEISQIKFPHLIHQQQAIQQIQILMLILRDLVKLIYKD